MDVGGAAGRSQSKALVEFRAGKMNINATNKMVTADKRKGLVSVYRSDDQLMHFTWKDRGTGTLEEDLIIFPGDVEFKAVPACTTGRVFVLKFRSSNKRMFFWMQEPNTDKENCKKVNDILHNLPAPGLPILSLPDETILKVLKSVGNHLVSASIGQAPTVKVWDINTGVCQQTIPAVSIWTDFAAMFTLEDNIVVTGHQDKTAKMWDILTGRHLLTFDGPQKHASHISSLHVEGKFVVTASWDGSIKLWNSKSGEFIRNLLELEEGGKVWNMEMEDAKIVASAEKLSGERETVVLSFDIEY